MATQSSREVLALRSLHELMTTVNAVDQLEDLLQTLVQGVVDILGFQIAVIYVLDGEDTLEIVAAAGDESARQAVIGRRIALAELSSDFGVAIAEGDLRFVPHDVLPADATFSWIPDIEPSEDPDAWHPLDAMYALLHDPAGRLLGVLGVDLPVDRMRPGLLRRQILEMYAVQAGLAIHHAQERARLSQQVLLGTASRRVVDAVTDRLDADTVLEQVVRPMAVGYRCDRVWLISFEDVDGVRTSALRTHPADLAQLRGAESDRLLEDLARGLLAERRARVVTWAGKGAGKESSEGPGVGSGEGGAIPVVAPRLRSLLDRLGDVHVLATPLGTGTQLLGCALMVRDASRSPWSPVEAEAAFALGQEIGRTVVDARLYATERRLNAELQELDRYKTELMDTITHELKAPLTVIEGHVELLEESAAPSASIGAIRRGTGRLQRLVEDLLLLARVKDHQLVPQRTPVDLAELIGELEDQFSVEVRRRALTFSCAGVRPGVVAWGDRDELFRALANVVGNAVKYTPDGGRVTLSLHRETHSAVFSCTDTGIGIDQADQVALFQEFNRSSNPEAHAIPGTGLGLAIVKRIVERHEGVVTVESARGSGSTFRIAVPVPPAEAAAG